MKLLSLLFPEKCIFCKKVLENGYVCKNCSIKLPVTEGLRAVKRGEFFSLCIAPFYYTGDVRDAILRYKFGGHQSYAVPFGYYCAKAASEHLSGEIDLITWVPISRKRMWKRGYDQAELLAKEISKRLKIPCAKTLVKKRHTPPQSGIRGEAERRANVSGAFKIARYDVTGKRILLIDDIITTGTTMSECAKVLLMAGADDIAGCALAKAE